MRLLNTSSFAFGNFIGNNHPQFAILSHTWGAEEVLYQDMMEATFSGKAGWSKVRSCCEKARADGYQWVWIDTCCIDKSSSSELSEAINSMYSWYKGAMVCYAYLQDVSDKPEVPGMFSPENFPKSRWFTRGWTLQELIAPKTVEFYTVDWVAIGTKCSLPGTVSRKTNIPKRILMGDSLSSCTVAQRMSWASARETTREEDIAYCLLGIFGVNMPLLYGEGQKAYLRLQTEIMKQEEDYTIFAWSLDHDCHEDLVGVLAPSPKCFAPVPADFWRPTLSEEQMNDLKLAETLEAMAADMGHTSWMDDIGERVLLRIPLPHFDCGPGVDDTWDWDRSSAATTLAHELRQQFYTPEFRNGQAFFPSQAFAADGLPDYRVLRNQGYDSIVNSHLTIGPGQPPETSSRGLLMTLLVSSLEDQESPSDTDSPILAWIQARTAEGRGVCILLRKVPSSDERRVTQYARYLPLRLLTINSESISNLKAMEIYLHPSGKVVEESDSFPAQPAESWGRLRMVWPDQTESLSVRYVHPREARSGDDVFFKGRPTLISAIGCSLTVEANLVHHFLVLVGFCRGRSWCRVEETESMGADYLEHIFWKEEHRLRENVLSNSSRSVYPFVSKPHYRRHMAITAVVRDLPCDEPNVAGLMLTVKLAGREDLETWAGLVLQDSQVVQYYR